MMFPQSVLQADESDTTYLVTLTADSTAHTKGAWVQLLPATTFDAFLVTVLLAANAAASSDTSALADIGIDAAGGTAYTVLIPNILCGHSGIISAGAGRRSIFEAYIPAGSTVAARFQSTVTSDVVSANITLHGGVDSRDPFPPRGLVVDYGTATASSSGTTPANALADAEGAWIEMTSATTRPHQGLTVAVQGSDAAAGNVAFLIDVGIGATSSEVALIEHVVAVTRTNETIYLGTAHPMFHRPVPEGSRLAVRAQADTNNNQANLDVAVYGWG